MPSGMATNKKKKGGRREEKNRQGTRSRSSPWESNSLDLSPPAPHLQNSGQFTQIISLSSLRFLSYKSRKNNYSYSEIL